MLEGGVEFFFSHYLSDELESWVYKKKKKKRSSDCDFLEQWARKTNV